MKRLNANDFFSLSRSNERAIISKTYRKYLLLLIICFLPSILNAANIVANTGNPQNSGNQVLQETEIDSELEQIIKDRRLSGVPQSLKGIPDIKNPKAQLGMKLFFSKSLGGDKTTACASCHHPMLGGGDNLSLSIGIDAENPDILGIHRKTRPDTHVRVPRNAPTTFNVAFYQRILFHDGRIERLGKHSIHTPDVPYPEEDALAGDTLVQAQARFPITSREEMRADYMKSSLNQTMRRELAKRLQKNWLEAFREGFSQPDGSAEDLITEQNFSEAIAEYERSQVFIQNSWKKYIDGNKNALSESAKKGALLFFKSHQNGGANCASCHSGDFFTNEIPYNTGMPQIGVGKNAQVDIGANQSRISNTNDYGCNLVTKKSSDKFRFRTPSLLNVEVTGPWGHSGAYTTLEGITRHMLSPQKAVINYDPNQITQNNIATHDVKKNTQEAVDAGLDLTEKPDLKEQDITQIVEFLKALTDPCVKDRACMSPWIPASSDNDPDHMMLHAINQENGNRL